MATEFYSGLAILGGFVAFAMAFAIGANDVANALGTSVGSGALTIKKAVIIAAIFEFLGTMIMGSFVAGTIEKGVINVNVYSEDNDLGLLVVGMFSALCAATVWLLTATWFALPVSTTHTIVGGIIGFSLVEKGGNSILPTAITKIILSWLISPVAGAIFAFIIFAVCEYLLIRSHDPFSRALLLFPIFSALTVSVLLLFIFGAELPRAGVVLPGWVYFLLFLGSFILAAIVSRLFVVPQIVKRHLAYSRLENQVEMKNVEEEKDENVVVIEDDIDKELEARQQKDTKMEHAESIFVPLMVLSAICVAFAHGANDVANAVGPFAAIIEYKNTGTISSASGSSGTVPMWIILLGGIGIVVGLAALGNRVMETIGKKITKLTYTRGYSAQIATAATVMLASFMGLPISTTHTLVGAVAGTAFVPSSVAGTEVGSIKLKMIGRIAGAWVVTIFAGAFLTILFFKALKPFAE